MDEIDIDDKIKMYMKHLIINCNLDVTNTKIPKETSFIVIMRTISVSNIFALSTKERRDNSKELLRVGLDDMQIGSTISTTFVYWKVSDS